MPACVELEQNRDVRLAVHAGRADVDPRRHRLARGRQLEVADAPGEQPQEVDPDPVDVALAVDGVELRPHDPRQDDHLPELPAAAPARSGAARALERLAAELLLEQIRLPPFEREQRPPYAVEVAAVERGLEPVDLRGLVSAHRAPSRQDAPTALRNRCAAASAIDVPPTSLLLSAVLPGHLPSTGWRCQDRGTASTIGGGSYTSKISRIISSRLE